MAATPRPPRPLSAPAGASPKLRSRIYRELDQHTHACSEKGVLSVMQHEPTPQGRLRSWQSWRSDIPLWERRIPPYHASVDPYLARHKHRTKKSFGHSEASGKSRRIQELETQMQHLRHIMFHPDYVAELERQVRKLTRISELDPGHVQELEQQLIDLEDKCQALTVRIAQLEEEKATSERAAAKVASTRELALAKAAERATAEKEAATMAAIATASERDGLAARVAELERQAAGQSLRVEELTQQSVTRGRRVAQLEREKPGE